MTKTELESKHIAELHALAAEAGVPRYRMLRKEELVEKLLGAQSESGPREREPGGERQRSRSRRSRGGESRERSSRERPSRERPPRQRPERAARQESPAAEATAEEKEAEQPQGQPQPTRRRRRRFGRKRKELRLPDLLLPATAGRQAIVYAETAEACTGLLRELAAEVSGANGTDPLVVLVDPGPEELADWRREAPEAEIVAAAQARHVEDALAQAGRRAEGGEAVVVLVDSLTRLAEKFGDADAARSLLDGSGALTVVAALERR